MAKYIDLSHTIEDGLKTYEGLPEPLICDYWSREESREKYDDGSTFQIAKIEMVSNTGTYIDCPFHRFHDGKSLNELLLRQLTDLEGVLIEVDYQSHGLAIDKKWFENMNLEGKSLLIQTNWSMHWNTPQYYHDHPFLTAEAALFLKDSGVVMVGIDSYNIDDTNKNIRPVHTALLGNDILIVEHMCNLKEIGNSPFTFSAVPPKIKGVGSFPVRAYARILDR